MKPALLMVDIQNDYFPGGKMELEVMQLAAQQAQKLLSYFRNQKWPVIFIQHLAIKPHASFFISGTPGTDIHDSIRPTKNETVNTKNFPNSFRIPAFMHICRH